jgi:hypothetical protein
MDGILTPSSLFQARISGTLPGPRTFAVIEEKSSKSNSHQQDGWRFGCGNPGSNVVHSECWG